MLSGPIDGIVAADDLVAAVRGDTVVLLTTDGATFARLGPRGQDQGGTAVGRGTGARVAEGILDLFGIDESDRDSAAADDLVDDELALAQRRQLRGAGISDAAVSRPVVLAGSSKVLWILLDGQLWRASRADGVRRIGRPAGRLDLMAATKDGALIAASGRSLLMSSDGGVTFAPIIDLPETPTRLAIAADGSAIAWASSGAIHLRAADDAGTPVRSDVGAVLDVRFCDGTAIALTETGMFAGAGQPRGWRRIAMRPDARGLACAASGAAPIVAVDPGVGLSFDGGATWLALDGAPPARTVAAAIGESTVWLATTVGLFGVARDRDPTVATAADQTQESVAIVVPVLARRPPVYAAWLPRLMVRATLLDSPGSRELRAVALADFPLGAATARVTPALPRPRLAALQAEVQAAPMSGAAGPRFRPLSAADSQCLGDVRSRAVKLAMAEPDRARSYVARAGYAAWLPELRVRVDRRVGRSESLDFKNGGVQPSAPLGLDTANDVRYEARATWDLAKLVFSTEELAAESQALHMADLRRDLESLANRLFFERRRLLMETGSGVADRSADLRRAVRIEELDAELDALSGGVFTTCRSEAATK